MTTQRPRRGPWAVTIGTAAATFAQAPGRLAADTKLDLVVDPLRFMGRAARMWDPQAAFGHVQNQAAGYLFPAAPFFALGQLVHAPMWAVQRMWMAAILVVAFWGALRVAEGLDVGTPATRLLGSAAYAVSPFFLSQIASTSAGQLPAALMPWTLWALIRGSRAGSARRWAAASGVSVVAMGGVNATATVGALVLPALFLLTRSRSARRGALLRWWVASVVLATAWWLVPLALQGQYGLDFLPYTESPAVTGATTASFEVIRGAGYWLSYLVTQGPWLPAGWTLVTLPIAILATGLAAAAGLFGLARRDMPERTFLVVGLTVGTIAVAAGYAGALSGPASGPMRELLEGALAPLRNLHKFEPVLRLPLALGLSHAVATLRVPRVQPRSVLVGAAVVVAVTAAPVWRNELVVPGAFERVPSYWRDTASWLDRQGDEGRSLVVPSAAFGEYRWGRPLDEPLQPLARTPWAVRNLVPLGSDGSTRLLDAIGRRLDAAQPSPGLATALEGAGIRFLVVRNDLDPARTAAPPPAQVRRALADVSGLRLVRRFGPMVAGGLSTARLAPDMSATDFRSVEIYEVTPAPGVVRTDAAEGALRVTGGPDALLALVDEGAPGPVRMEGEANVGRPIVTDAWRRRDVDFGAVRENVSYVLTADEPAPATGKAPRDRIAVPPAGNRSPAAMTGAARLLDSSFGTRAALPEHQPFAAFDGDPSTAWVAPPLEPQAGAWIEVRLARAFTPRAIAVAPLRDRQTRAAIVRVRVTTDAGTRVTTLQPQERQQPVTVAPGPTTRIRLTIEEVKPARGAAAPGVRELSVDGLRIERLLDVPAPRSRTPATYLFERGRADPYDLGRADEEGRIRRRFATGAGGAFSVTGTASGRPGAQLDSLVAKQRRPPAVAATASSTWRRLPAFGAAQLTDGDSATAWLADPDDTRPYVRLVWPAPLALSEVRFRRPPGPTRFPTRVRLVAGNQARTVRLDSDGTGRFESLTTSEVEVRVLASAPTNAARAGASPFVRAAVGAAEISFGGAFAPQPADTSPVSFTLPCGSGPPVVVDGVGQPTAVEGTVADLIALRPLRITGCGDVILDAGDHVVEGALDGALVIDTVALAPTGSAAQPAVARTARVTQWTPEQRRLDIGSGGAAFLTVAENFNRGWRATLDGHELEPVRMDGWSQGWRVPAGTAGTVRLTFGPGRLYRAGLAAGAAAVFVLVLLAAVRERRPEDRPPAAPWTMGRSAFAALTVVALVILGGLAGVLAAAAALVVPVRRATMAAACLLGATGVAVAGLGDAWPTSPGRFAPAVQALTLLAIAAVIAPRRRAEAALEDDA